MRCISIILLAGSLAISSLAEVPADEARKNGMLETMQNYIEHSSIIVDICVYEQTWIPPTAEFDKGQLIQRAVVTNVHCGSIKVGDRIEYTHYIEEAPRLFATFTSTVPGLLRTSFFAPDQSEKIKEGWLKIEGDAHWGFSRVDSDFAKLFELERKTNLKLKAAAGQ